MVHLYDAFPHCPPPAATTRKAKTACGDLQPGSIYAQANAVALVKALPCGQRVFQKQGSRKCLTREFLGQKKNRVQYNLVRETVLKTWCLLGVIALTPFSSDLAGTSSSMHTLFAPTRQQRKRGDIRYLAHTSQKSNQLSTSTSQRRHAYKTGERAVPSRTASHAPPNAWDVRAPWARSHKSVGLHCAMRDMQRGNRSTMKDDVQCSFAKSSGAELSRDTGQR